MGDRDTNATYAGYTALGYTNFSFGNVKGCCWSKDAQTGNQYTRGNAYRYSGKRYIEINYRTNAQLYNDIQYRLGLATALHPVGAMLGDDDQSWALETETVKIVHNAISNDPPVGLASPFTDFKNYNDSRHGWFGHYDSYSDDLIWLTGVLLLIAVDFDAGKAWFGHHRNGVVTWGGDPAAGSGELFSFAPNTPLSPAIIGWSTYVPNVQKFMGIIGARADTTLLNPPNGFSYWDIYPIRETVIADDPVGYWFSNPPDATWAVHPVTAGPYSIGTADSSRYKRHGKHMGALYASDVPFFGRAIEGYYSSDAGYIYNLECALDSGASFSIEAIVRITGDGRIGGATGTWKEGSFLLCNAQQFKIATADANIWTGVSLRGRKVCFGVGAFEVSTPNDLADGAYHLVVECDVAASAIRIFIDTVQVAETTGYIDPVRSAAYIAVGLTLPVATEGGFPGYFRDIAVYSGILSAARKQAHFSAFSDHPLPLPITVKKDPVGSLIPNFMR